MNRRDMEHTIVKTIIVLVAITIIVALVVASIHGTLSSR